MSEAFHLKGKLQVEHYRKNILIGRYDCNNGITNVGKNYILDVMFNGGTQIANNSWYIGLIDNSGFSALAAGDTASSHSGWTELTAYTQSTRIAWGSGSASSQATTNSTPATFDMNATNNVYGGFIASSGTKGGTSGILWATAGFSSVVPVSNGDQIKITYTVSC